MGLIQDHTSLVYNDKMWVFGGNSDGIWYSDNGSDWELETDSAEWSLRGDHFFFEFKNKMWILGGEYRNFGGGWIHLRANDIWCSEGVVSIETDDKIKNDFHVFNAYNRPQNKVIDIDFVLNRPSIVKITVYNCSGQKMRVLMNNRQKQGAYRVQWDRKCASGKIVPSGSYYVSFGTQEVNRTVKVVLIN